MRAFRLETDREEHAEHLFRRLLGAYLNGAEWVEVLEPPRLSAGTRTVARELVRRTRGFRIAEETNETLRLEGVEEPSTVSVAGHLWHLGDLVTAAHRAAVGSWEQLPLYDDGRWQDADDRVDREVWHLQRLLASGRGRDPWGLPTVASWTIALALERIADQALILGRAGDSLAELGVRHEKVLALRQLHRQALEHLEAVVRIAHPSRGNELLDVGEALLISGDAIEEGLLPLVASGRVSPAAALAFDRALGALRATVGGSQEIGHIILDRTLGVAPAWCASGELHTAR